MREVVKDIEHLKDLSIEGEEFFILLNGGLRSSKHINYDEDEKTFIIINEIDSTEQELTEKELFDESITNIGKALKLNALFKY